MALFPNGVRITFCFNSRGAGTVFASICFTKAALNLSTCTTTSKRRVGTLHICPGGALQSGQERVMGLTGSLDGSAKRIPSPLAANTTRPHLSHFPAGLRAEEKHGCVPCNPLCNLDAMNGCLRSHSRLHGRGRQPGRAALSDPFLHWLVRLSFLGTGSWEMSPLFFGFCGVLTLRGGGHRV
jgi:hypothetical protein